MRSMKHSAVGGPLAARSSANVGSTIQPSEEASARSVSYPEPMRIFFSKAFPPAGLRTLAICLLIEALLLTVLYLFTSSVAGSVILSVFIFGPVSLFVAAPIYRRLTRSST